MVDCGVGCAGAPVEGVVVVVGGTPVVVVVAGDTESA